MRYLIDTDWLIDHLNGVRNVNVEKRLTKMVERYMITGRDYWMIDTKSSIQNGGFIHNGSGYH